MFRWLRRFFNRVKPAPKPVPVEVDTTFVTKWGQIIPHERNKPGADNFDDTIHEYRYGVIMSDMLRMPSADRTGRGVFKAAKELFKKKVTCSIETHFNAYNSKAKGFEILVLDGDVLSAKYARILIAEFVKAFPDRMLRGDNGIRWIKKNKRGYYNLINAKNAGMKVAILSEFFFGDNEFDYIIPAFQAKVINEAFIDI